MGGAILNPFSMMLWVIDSFSKCTCSHVKNGVLSLAWSVVPHGNEKLNHFVVTKNVVNASLAWNSDQHMTLRIQII